MLSLHCNGSNIMGVTVSVFLNASKIYQFKAKDSEIKPYPSCLGNISKYSTIDNMEKTELNRNIKVFSVNYNAIDIYRY